MTSYSSGIPSERPELGTRSSAVLSELQNREWQNNIKENLNNCKDVIEVEKTCVESVVESGYSSKTTPFLFQMEKSFLDISSPSLTDGTFYLSLFLVGRRLYCRFFESGIFAGFFLSAGLQYLRRSLERNYDNFQTDHLLWYQVYNEEDISSYGDRYTMQLKAKRDLKELKKIPTEVGRRFKKILEENKSSIVQSHKKLMAKAQADGDDVSCQLLGTIVHTVKSDSHKHLDGKNARFLECSGTFHGAVQDWENSFLHFRTGSTDNQHRQCFSWKQLMSAPENNVLPWDKQCLMLASIPNNHYWKEGAQSHIGFAHMLSVADVTGKYKPASPRNQTLFHFRNGNIYGVHDIFRKMLSPNCLVSSSVDFHQTHEVHTEHEPPRKRQRASNRRVTTLSEDDILQNITIIDPTFTTQNRASISSYNYYKTSLIERGDLYWRLHDNNMDIFLMNDINIENGNFLPFSYVHMTKIKCDSSVEYNCTCHLYGTLMQIASLDVSEEDIFAAESVNIKCCHIRFFQEYIESHLEDLFQMNEDPDANHVDYIPLIMNSISYFNDSICSLPSSTKTKKFSVISQDGQDCNFVHLAENRLSCQSGLCNTTHRISTRKVRYLENTTCLCPHLEAMNRNKDSWLLQELLDFDESDDEDEPVAVDDGDCDDDRVLGQANPKDKKENFNVSSGLWDFPSLSTHKPKPDGDPKSREAIHIRQKIYDGGQHVTRNPLGYLTSSELCRLFPRLNQQQCHCGAGYYNTEFPQGRLSHVKYRPSVYLQNGPSIYMVQDRECLAANPDCTVNYFGTSDDSIHFLSKDTGAGDEIGYDFIDHALNTHITFSAFCSMKSIHYKRLCNESANFMSTQTFIAWWFSWSSNFKIDFRQPCYICKDKPKFLACDGTKIGINFRHASIEPIEKPNSDDIVDPCHRRNERAFLSFSQLESKDKIKNVNECRDHLLYISKKILGMLKKDEIMADEMESPANMLLIDTVDEECRVVMRKFIFSEYPQNIQNKLAILFKALSSSHSLSGLIPFRYVYLFQNILEEIRTGVFDSINQISIFSPEIKDLLYCSAHNRVVLQDLSVFFDYLLKRLNHFMELNKNPDTPIPQSGTYNPEKYGRAYYFTRTGERLRDIPVYTMTEQAHSNNYDDPFSGQEAKCNKLFPQVSRKGTTYLFLWFCPKHYGHCYGYHMIPGSEGRKDPFSSSYAYMKEAPDELFYDFSCQLEEYCLNREPGFFQNTRFFHDLFHGCTHKCPFFFKSQRLSALKDLNTEICEQFNSFIQKIKFSARAMTLSKFNFYLQFMIFQWCEKKKENFRRRCNVAAGYLI